MNKVLPAALLAFLAASPLLRAEAGLEDISTAPAPAHTDAEAQYLDKSAALGKETGVRQEIHLDYSYAGDSKLKSGASGDLGEQSMHFGYGFTIPLDAKWSLRWGVEDNRIDFGRPSGSALPQNLQTVSTTFGAGYKIDDKWSVFAGVSPRLSLMQGWDRVDAQEVEIGGMLGATYIVNPDLVFTFGLGVNPGTDGIPVLPIAGVRWKFEKDWTLNVGVPRTSIDYQLLPNLRLSPLLVGFEGGEFHTSKTYGTNVGLPQLNDRKMHYNEVRVGVGAGYKILPNMTADLSGGVIAYREFDFKDAGYSPKTDPAPYVQIGLRVGF